MPSIKLTQRSSVVADLLAAFAGQTYPFNVIVANVSKGDRGVLPVPTGIIEANIDSNGIKGNSVVLTIDSQAELSNLGYSIDLLCKRKKSPDDGIIVETTADSASTFAFKYKSGSEWSYSEQVEKAGSIDQIGTTPGVKRVGSNLFVVGEDGTKANVSAKSTVGRPKLLVFGNSLALQNLTTLLQGTNVTTTTAVARRGSKALVVSNSTGAVAGNKLAIGLYFGGTFYATIDTVPDSTHINILESLPAAVLSGAVVHWYTTSGVDDWVYQAPGPVYSACMMLGMPVDVIHGYGYGGAYAQAMLSDLERVLRITLPQYVAFNLFENDINNLGAGNVTAETARLTRLMHLACELSISSGAIPIFLSPYPATGVNSANEAALWDAMRDAVLTISSVYPMAAGIDTSTPWLGATSSTTRHPIAGWVDGAGIHPLIIKQAVIGKIIKTALSAVVGSATSFKNRAIQYLDMTGSGGAGIGAGYSTGPVADGVTLAISANLSGTVSKTADDKQRVVVTNTGATTYGTHYFSITSGTLGNDASSASSFGGQWIKGVATVKCNTAAKINRATLQLKFLPGNQTHKALAVNGGATGGWLSEDNYFDGETFTIETGSVQVPNDATGYTLELMIQPNTEATIGAVVGDFTFLEMGTVTGTSDLISSGL